MSDRRPQTPTREVRRQRIIDAAIECLAREGWHRTTLTAIAAEAGISRGLISYHFTGRDDLLAAVLESVVESTFGAGAAAMQQQIDQEPTAQGKLRALIEGNLQFIGDHRREMAALGEVMPNLRRPDGSPRFDSAAEEPIIAGTAALFEHGMSTGEFRRMDPRATAYFLRRCIDAAARRIVEDPEFDPGTYATELTDLFLHGVRA